MENNIKTAFALIRHNGKILLIQEGFEPAYGKWCLPGGHVEKGEELNHAAAREASEETGGLKINIGDMLVSKIINNTEYNGRSEENGMRIELNIFKATVSGGEINKGRLTEELDARWFTEEEAKSLPLRWDWLKELF